jgi:hypothetical protein
VDPRPGRIEQERDSELLMLVATASVETTCV